jgi:signal transduction histidine kinase/CheY-like chemotaxis protein
MLFESLVDNLARPIIVFQGSLPFASSFPKWKCVFYNKAFCALTGGNESPKKLIGTVVGDHFPNLVTLCLNKSKNESTLEAIVYEDKHVPKDLYTLTFFHPEETMLAVKIDQISAELQAKRLADEITETKEQFIANISHEIRTPLNGIIGYISMMSDPKELSSLTDYQKNCFEQIHDCSMTLLSIMNDILDFSKLNADQMQLQESPFDLAECVEKSYDVIKPTANQKGLEVAFYIHPNVPPRIKGDFKRLRQVLLNLLSNGVKFTKRGRIDTTITLLQDPITHSELDVNGCYTIEFTVEDTGIGISASNQHLLFKSFSQIDQSNQKSHSGTGLGLVISKKLVELMGGTIRVESMEGEGSKFIFTIKAEEARAISADANDEFLPLLKDKSVLIVDDHVTNRITIASNMVQWGMKPYVCSSAEEALMYLRSGVLSVEFALIDMRMPKMDGNELAEKIKNIKPKLPLIAISSTGLSTTATLNKNFNFYLAKPIKSRQLYNVCVATIKKLDANQQSNTPMTSPATPKINVNPDSFYTPSISCPPITKCKQHDRSVLIAEDLETNQRVIQGYLEKLGFSNFTLAQDGKETIEAVRNKHHDIILMDLKMPHIDGFEATRRIRKFYKKHPRPGVKVQPYIIALTANTFGNIKERCMDAGMDAYICKPLNITELAKILDDSAAKYLKALQGVQK